MKVLVVASNKNCPSEISTQWPTPHFLERAPVEEALRLRESGKADAVVIVSVGDVEARILLRLALGMGADRAILVQANDGACGEETSALLTAVAARERPDLILLGRSAGEAIANGTAATAVSDLAEDACRYPTIVQIRNAAAKRLDIIAAAELR
jgi:electron transfer flavoprotein beta subunit